MPEPGAENLRRSHTSTSEWQSFEVRMRRRRALRCVLRAEVALEAGYPEDARAAIEEARRLDPAVLGIDALTARMPGPSTPAVRPRQRTYLIGALAASLVFAVMAALSSIPSQPDGLATPVVSHSTADSAAPAEIADARRRASVSIREEIIVAPLVASDAPARPALAAEPPPPPATQRAARESTTREPTTREPATVTATTGSAPVRPQIEDAPRSAAAPPPPAEPVARALALPPAVEPVPATPEPAAPPPARATAEREPDAVVASREIATIDDAARVRAVLSRYAAAYSGLDASAARAVWPAVDERALARAFSGLQSQSVSLENCEVSVSGASARAQCHGSASWVPKVGGSGRTESRQWSFDLRNTQGGWHITRAEAR